MAKETKYSDIISKRYDKCKELAQDIFDKVEINRALYRSELNIDDTYEWDFTLTDPYVFPLVRNYSSRTNPSLTKIRLEARKPEDYENRQINQDFVNWELNEILLTSLFHRVYYSSFITGKGFLKTGWKYEPAVEVHTDTGVKKVIREITNRADAKFVRFNDLLIPNRNIPNIEEQPYTLELIQKNVGEILSENEKEEYWKKDWIEKLRKNGVTKKLLDYEIDFASDDDVDDFSFKSAYVSLICMYTKEGDVLYIPFDAKDQVVNKIQENQYWHGHYPYIDFTLFPEDDEFYSMGVVDVVGDLQVAATELLNQMLTNVRQVNYDMWIAGSAAAQTPDWQFSKRPNGIIRVAGDANQIQQVRTADNASPTLRISQDIQNKIERAGGISSLYASGAPSQSINQTARGAQIIDQNIDTNMRMIIDLFGERVIKRLGEHFLELNAQYVTEEQTFFITGKKNVRDIIAIDPEHVSANFDVFINAERMVKQTPASRQASLQNLIMTLNGISNQSGVMTDLTPVVEALIDSYPEMENIDEVVVSVDEKAKRDIATLERGQEVEVKVRDPHLELLQVVQIHLEDNADSYPEEVMAVFGKYITDHIRFIQAAQEIKMMSQPQLPIGQEPEALVGRMGGGPKNPDALNSEQAGLPENQKTYNLGQIVPPKSEL